MIHFGRNARSPEQANPDTTRFRADIQDDLEICAVSEPAQTQEQDGQWTPAMEVTGSTMGFTVSNITLGQATIGDAAERTRAQAAP